jgi:hypothetical protein
MGRGKKVQKFLRLNRINSDFVKASNDPLIRQLPGFLAKFSEYPNFAVRYDWKTLTDEGFENWSLSLDKGDLVQTNKVLISSILRSIEAFQFVSVWRMADLMAASINSINNNYLVSAAATSRSAIELAARYIYAAHELNNYMQLIPWEKINSHPIALEYLENPQDTKNVKRFEHYVDQLMWGARLEEALDVNPSLSQKNILTIIDKFDDRLGDGNMGHKIRPHYDLLSEAAHPNCLGFMRFCQSETHMADERWKLLEMRENADGGDAEMLRSETMWALAFSACHSVRCFHIFAAISENAVSHLGAVLPLESS